MLEQSDGTGWMGFYALSMAAIASILNRRGRPATDLVLKFLEHFALISRGARVAGSLGRGGRLLLRPAAPPRRLGRAVKVRSIVGILPLLGVAAIDEARVERAETREQAGARAARRPAADHGSQAGSVASGTAGCCSASSASSRVLRLLHRGSSTRRSSCRRTGCAPCRAGTPSIRSSSTSTGTIDAIDYEPGRVDDRHVRRQLELARADLDAGQLPRRRGARAATRASSATTHGRVPDRLGQAS